jgi:antitoxin VapB
MVRAKAFVGPRDAPSSCTVAPLDCSLDTKRSTFSTMEMRCKPSVGWKDWHPYAIYKYDLDMEAAMALSIKTDEADRLARELSRLTGETMTDAITRAMRERLERLRAEQEANSDYVARMKAFVRERADRYDRRPVTKQEWDEAVGDTPEDLGLSQ